MQPLKKVFRLCFLRFEGALRPEYYPHHHSCCLVHTTYKGGFLTIFCRFGMCIYTLGLMNTSFSCIQTLPKSTNCLAITSL